jgi:phage terminase large subunit
VITTRVYEPRGACRESFLSRAPELLLAGPAGTGKSRALLEKIHYMSMLNAGMRSLLVRKTRASLQSAALVTWRTQVINEALLAGDVEYYGGSAKEHGYYYRNGSVVVTGGMDKDRKVMSTEFDVVYVQEAVELLESDWEALLSRLRNNAVSFQQICGDTNPDVPTHWLNQRPTIRMYHSVHTDNPVLYEDGMLTPSGSEYIDKLRALTGVRRQRLLEGKWVAAEGIIYEDFSPAVHLVSSVEVGEGEELDHAGVPLSWTRYWSVDFGTTNPFVCQHWAEDHDGRLYLYREFYRTNRTVHQHALDILAVVAPEENGVRVWREPKPRAIICDHDLGERLQLESDLGLSTVAAHKDVIPGIQAVSQRFTVGVDGRSRLYLRRDALVRRDRSLADRKLPLCTQDEIPGYVWDGTKEKPVKEDDHGCDAMRYMVAYRDLVPHARVRFFRP